MKNKSLSNNRPCVFLWWKGTLYVFFTVLALFVAFSASAKVPPLEVQIQKELDASPFLAAQQLKMRVLNEHDGVVVIELSQGPQKLRDMLRRGYEIDGSALAEKNLEPEMIKALRSLKRTLNGIKHMQGVKEISLTGALSPAVPDSIPSEKPHDDGTRLLEERIQKELDDSPFLAERQLKMHVLEVRGEGSVTLELTTGPQTLRDMLRRGYEIEGSALAESNLEPDAIKALRGLKRTLTAIKAIPGVKEISLTGALSSAVPTDIPAINPTRQESIHPLVEQIQKTLDATPFLADQRLKMRVLDEEQGSVTLELTEGPDKLREMLRKGYDLDGSIFRDPNLEPEVIRALHSVKKTVVAIQNIPGLKAITVTGSLSQSLKPKNSNAQITETKTEASLLEKEIQERIDASPFLAEQQVRMRILGEKDGVVRKEGMVYLEVSEGPKKLRDLLRKGYDINSDALREMSLPPEVLKPLRSIKKILTIIKGMNGVQEITITGAINTNKDRAENYYDEALLKISQNNTTVGQDSLELLVRSAELGFLRAQTELVKIYDRGVDLMPDAERANYWLRQAAGQGDPTSQFQLATRCEQAIGMERDYKEAISWYQKCIGQDRSPDIRTRSLIALASLLATCPVKEVTDGTAALECAKKAVAAAPNGIAMEALAAAYARCGRFEEAIEQQKKWIKQVQSAKFLGDRKESMLESAKERLEIYLKRQPYTAEE